MSFRDIPDPYQPRVKRGVYAPAANFPGVRRVEIVDSSGGLMFKGEGRTEIMTDEFEKALRRLLEEQDTGFRLRILPGA